MFTDRIKSLCTRLKRSLIQSHDRKRLPSRYFGEATAEIAVPLASVFTRECIVKVAPELSKVDVIGLLVSLLAHHNRLEPRHVEYITRRLTEGESYGSSAIGMGLAFPHLRTSEVPHFAGAIAVAPEGIDFDSLDHEPTKLVFLTLSPFACREQHSRLLSRLFSLTRDKVMHMQLQHLIQPDDVFGYLLDMDLRSAGIADRLTSISGQSNPE